VRPIGNCITHDHANLRKEAAASGRSPIPLLSRIWRWSQTTAIPSAEELALGAQQIAARKQKS